MKGKITVAATLAALFGLAGAEEKSSKTCTALAMSGGGAKGAYEAGALWGLYYGAKDKSAYQYDVATGVSAGAINTAALSVYAPGDEVNMLDFLSESWQNLENKDVYKNWRGGPVRGVIDESGIFNDQPLTEFLDGVYKAHDYKLQRKVEVSCVDVNSGSYITFNETATDIVKSVVSSASIPFIFPHQYFPDRNIVCMDGGTGWNTNLVSAVRRCREQVDSDSQITVDIVMCGSSFLSEWEDKNNGYSNQIRFKEIRQYYDDLQDVYEFKQSFPEVNYRHLVMPTGKIKGGLNMINFNNATNTYAS
mmetsp:Transcript_17322/g.29135  ORF Transcript_17322/g.29135 Transcript_17322/m.29135 type:complete len:306 (-) Transcript_17322:238-1155(-)